MSFFGGEGIHIFNQISPDESDSFECHFSGVETTSLMSAESTVHFSWTKSGSTCGRQSHKNATWCYHVGHLVNTIVNSIVKEHVCSLVYRVPLIYHSHSHEIVGDSCSPTARDFRKPEASICSYKHLWILREALKVSPPVEALKTQVR